LKEVEICFCRKKLVSGEKEKEMEHFSGEVWPAEKLIMM
jgi:hypothetical protein